MIKKRITELKRAKLAIELVDVLLENEEKIMAFRSIQELYRSTLNNDDEELKELTEDSKNFIDTFEKIVNTIKRRAKEEQDVQKNKK